MSTMYTEPAQVRVETSHASEVSSSDGIGVVGPVGPGRFVVPWIIIGQAPLQAHKELVGKVAEGGVVVVAAGPASIVAGTDTDGVGEHRERAPVAGVSESLVAGRTCFDVVRAPRRDRGRSGSRIGAQVTRFGQSCSVVADFTEKARRKDRR